MFQTIKKIAKKVMPEGGFFWKITTPLYMRIKQKFVPWIPNQKKVEIEITTMCSLACFNCDRSVRQAPCRESMSLSQIEKFVNESFALKWQWERISLIGGEPTLHPQFFQVLEIVKKYKNRYPNCVIELTTNGRGPKVLEVLSKVPDWVFVRNSQKQSVKHKFSSYNIAPIDLKKYKNADFSKGCWVTTICGLGLTRHGFYPCGAGGSLDRVFGFGIGLKNLSEVNDVTLKSQLKILCKYCGHFKDNRNAKKVDEEVVSQSWQKAYEDYKKIPPLLEQY